MTAEIEIRDGGMDGLRMMLRWAAQEGWNPGLHDAEAFYAADPHGYRVAYLDGKAVGTYSMVRYDEEMAFAGFYITVKGERGHGIGRVMLEALFKEAEPYNLCADGVLAMVPTYERHGFRMQFRSGRMTGIIKGRKDGALRTLDDAGFEGVNAYDRGVFAHPRRAFLKEFLAAPDTHVAVSVDGKGKVNGYGVLRQCVTGHKLAPLFADSVDVAERILLHLASFAPQEIYLDVPDPNAAGMALADKYDMREVFACARICTKRPEPIPLPKVFGITSFELG